MKTTTLALTLTGILALIGPRSANAATTAEVLSPWDDAAFYFKGGTDLNGNGVFDSNSQEFVNIIKAGVPGDALHKATLCGAGTENDRVEMRRGDVRMNFGNRTLKDAPYLHFPQNFVKTGEDESGNPTGTLYSDYIAMPNFLTPCLPSGASSITNYTVFVRFRQHERVCRALEMNNLIMLGFDWQENGGSGLSLALTDTSDKTATNRIPRVFIGAGSYSCSISGLVCPFNQWNELAVTVSGNTVTIYGATGYAGSTTKPFASQTLTIDTTRFDTALKKSQFWCRKLGNEANGSGTFTDNGKGKPSDNGNYGKAFRGDIQAFAFWPRALTRLEVQEVFSDGGRPRLAGAGFANGSMDEFTRTSDTCAFCDSAATNWNPVLNAAHPSASQTFTVDYYGEGLAQFLRLRPTPDSAAANIAVTIDGKFVAGGRAEPGDLFFRCIRKGCFTRGSHTIAFTRADAGEGDFKIDAFALGNGGWNLGDSARGSMQGFAQENSNDPPDQYQQSKAIYGRDGFVADGDLSHFTRGFVNAQNDAVHTYRFSLPQSVKDNLRKATFSFYTSNFHQDSASFAVYMNGTSGTKIASFENVKSYKTFSTEVPLDLLVAGENVLTVAQTDFSNSAWTCVTHYTLSLKGTNGGSLLLLR